MSRVPVAWRRAAVATLVLWFASTAIAVVAAGTLPANDPVAVAPAEGFGGWPAPPTDATGSELVGSALVRADALWYLAIAADGYPTTSEVPQAAAFFPGYPAVVAGVAGLLGGRTLLAAQLVALTACATALVGLQRLVALLGPGEGPGDDDLQARAVLVAVAFPTSFFLVAPYAEGLFLAAAAWALVHAARGRPWLAAALTAAATLTRPVGALLAVPLLLGVVTPGRGDAPHWRTGRGLVERVVPASGAAVALAALAVHGAVRWGDPLAVVHAQSAWQRDLRAPWSSLVDAARFALGDLGAGFTGYHLLDLLVLVVSAGAVVALARRAQWPLVAHAAANALLWLAQPFPSRPLLSTPRFAVVVPGVLLGLAVATGDRRVERWWLPVSGALLALHLTLFSRWWFVF